LKSEQLPNAFAAEERSHKNKTGKTCSASFRIGGRLRRQLYLKLDYLNRLVQFRRCSCNIEKQKKILMAIFQELLSFGPWFLDKV